MYKHNLVSRTNLVTSSKLFDTIEAHPDSKRLFQIAENLSVARQRHLEYHSSKKQVQKNSFIKSIAKKLYNRDWRPEVLTVDILKRKESIIGASLFYSGRQGERMEFFNDSQKSWFFYHSLTDKNGITRSSTLHYEVHPNGIMRVSSNNGLKCEFIGGQEYDNFIRSAEIYHDRVMKQIYDAQSRSLDKIS